MNYWRVCSPCGEILYPKADKNKMIGITVSQGTCPRCKKKKKWLIPISDYRHATGELKTWD